MPQPQIHARRNAEGDPRRSPRSNPDDRPSLALEIFASLVTAGVGAISGLVLTADIVKKIKDTGTAIKGFITAEKFEAEAAEVVKAENTLERTTAELEQVDALEAKTIEQEAKAAESGAGPTSEQTAGKQAAEDLRARLAASGETISKTRNVATARGTIDGEEISLDAVSGLDTPSGTVKTPDNPVLIPKSIDNTIERPTDSEFKILDQLAQKLNPDSKGVINLRTEREPCPACSNVIKQFEQKFPGVKVNLE
ncbi:hypothetical protein GL307_29660 [Nocardia seriolae]|nr:hypothetical protein [Nocardia seriolae]